MLGDLDTAGVPFRHQKGTGACIPGAKIIQRFGVNAGRGVGNGFAPALHCTDHGEFALAPAPGVLGLGIILPVTLPRLTADESLVCLNNPSQSCR